MTGFKRFEEIDFLKGIGILLVIVGHIYFDKSYIMKPIYLFHMPLFFLISGYLENDKILTKKEILTKKAKSLLYPYFIFGIIFLIINTAFDFSNDKFLNTETLLKRICTLMYGNTLVNDPYNYIGTEWFLAALFSTSVFYKMFVKNKNEKTKLIIVFAAVLVGILDRYFVYGNYISLPYCIDVSFFAIPFYYIGDLLRRNKTFLNSIQTSPRIFKWVGAGIVISIVSAVLNYTITSFKNEEFLIYMINLKFGNIFLFYVTAIVMSFVLLIFVSFIYSKGFRILTIEKMGELSLLIMLLHLYVSKTSMVIFNRLTHKNINQTLLFILVIAVTYFISCFISKHMKWLYKYK